MQMSKNRRTVTDSHPASDDDSEESDGNGKPAEQNDHEVAAASRA